MAAAAEAISRVSTNSVIDIEALLAPIPGDNPAGRNLQYSGLHDELREARRADEDLSQGDWKHEPKAADWKLVIQLSTDALTTSTKDLQICAWLGEALSKVHGFAGVRDSLKVMRGLHELFWDTVYPENDDGDLDARANSLSWLDRQLATALKETPITKGAANYSFLQFEDGKQFDVPENFDQLGSEQQARINELKATAAQEGRINSEQWRIAKNTTRRAFYEETNTMLDECWNEFQALDRVMDEKFDRQTPGLGSLKKSLDDVRTLIGKIVKEKRAAEPDAASPAGQTDTDAGTEVYNDYQGNGSGHAGAVSTGPIRSREEALRRLSEVADFFRRTEPQSPVSYLAQRAVRWGQMPLEGWLQEVVKDGAVLEQLRETLGLKSNSE